MYYLTILYSVMLVVGIAIAIFINTRPGKQLLGEI